jgi:2-oxoglutarate ferredoxin oxidoreductase subunit alpha
LLFILHASQGEFPRAIFAPGTVEEAFHLTVKAFNIAEKYQVPVIILTDQHLADSYSNVEKFDLSSVKIERGTFVDPKSGDYKRHKLTESGVSPRAFPGQKGVLVVTDSDEHTEDGHLTEDLELRPKMVLKRLHKLMGVRQEIQNPRTYGSDNAKITLIGWGSTYGAIREAVDILRSEGVDVNMLHFSEIWPLPAEAVSKVIDKAELTIIVENNATGQLAHLIKAETGRSVHRKILKFDGRPFSPAYIVRRVKMEMKK